MIALPRRSAAFAGIAALFLVAACGSGASADEVAGNGAVPAVANGSGATPAAMASAAAPSIVANPEAGGAVRCPATLVAGALPADGRLIGNAPASALPLSSATVTADAVAAIDPGLSGLAEIEPEDGPARAGIETQLYQVEPSADAPHTLVCRYGAPTPPLMAQAALLLPIVPRAGGYRCTVELPQGSDPRAATARCSAA